MASRRRSTQNPLAGQFIAGFNQRFLAALQRRNLPEEELLAVLKGLSEDFFDQIADRFDTPGVSNPETLQDMLDTVRGYFWSSDTSSSYRIRPVTWSDEERERMSALAIRPSRYGTMGLESFVFEGVPGDGVRVTTRAVLERMRGAGCVPATVEQMLAWCAANPQVVRDQQCVLALGSPVDERKLFGLKSSYPAIFSDAASGLFEGDGPMWTAFELCSGHVGDDWYPWQSVFIGCRE